jgi:hypothetical protein
MKLLINIFTLFFIVYSLGLFVTFNFKWPKKLTEFERVPIVIMLLIAICVVTGTTLNK